MGRGIRWDRPKDRIRRARSVESITGSTLPAALQRAPRRLQPSKAQMREETSGMVEEYLARKRAETSSTGRVDAPDRTSNATPPWETET